MQDSTKNLYIENENGQKLFYHFNPSVLISNFVPLIVILDNESASILKDFEYKMWNVLVIHNSFANKNTSLTKLLSKIILSFAEEYECEEHIYLYANVENEKEAHAQSTLVNANSIHIANSKSDLTTTLDYFEKMISQK